MKEVLKASPYKSYTYNSSSAIQRWVHNKRFGDAIKLLKLNKNTRLLDYGCGDGRLLALCGVIVESRKLFGFEPCNDLRLEADELLKGEEVGIVGGTELLL